MPVLNYVPQDPTDLVIQGDKFRQFAMGQMVQLVMPFLNVSSVTPMVQNDETNFSYYTKAGNIDILRSPFNGSMVGANGCISTPCGACVPIMGGGALINPFMQATNLFAISGVTKDSTGASLGNCRVTALETGRIENDLIDATVGETISDGSGNYSINVAMNTAHQLIGYKAGGTDVAGVTRNDVTPTHVG